MKRSLYQTVWPSTLLCLLAHLFLAGTLVRAQDETPPPPPSPTVEITSPPTAVPETGLSVGSFADLAVPLILLGLFLLAALAIGLLIRQARRSSPRPPAPAPSRAGVPLPIAPEAITQVLSPVYLQLESDPPRRFAIYETPFGIGLSLIHISEPTRPY